MRRARRVDANQAEIVRALRDAGRFVEVLSDVGRGVPDLLVSWASRCLLMEVKVPGAKLTPAGMDEEDIDSFLSAIIGLCLIGLQKTANRRKKGRRR